MVFRGRKEREATSVVDSLIIHRPRNVDWKRAAAILYGDLGTSKAYVIGLAFVAAGFSSLPIILAVCGLTALVAYNYLIICKHFPDGGGVYSAARDQSRLLAVIGALLLVADLTVTASLSGWSALSYFGVSSRFVTVATMGAIVLVGVINYFGPKHSGSIAVSLALPMVAVVILLIVLSAPHLTFQHLEPMKQGFRHTWVAFVGVILALSGIEAIANLTGVMKLDPHASLEHPKVVETSRKAIWLVGIEVVLGTALLGWAMLSLSREFEPRLLDRKEDMLRFLGEHYGELTLGAGAGRWIGILIGVVVGLLLLSAVNTAIVALIGLMYMMARDGEMPKGFSRLNPHGVPWFPLVIAVALPILVLTFADHFESLAALYAIGVVGAIAVNLGSCTFNKKLHMPWHEKGVMGMTFMLLCAIEISIAKTKPDALFFACCVLIGGLGLRSYAQKRAGLKSVLVFQEVAAAVSPEIMDGFRLKLTEGQRILVAVRGLTPVLRYAMEEARLRKGALYVLFVKELAVAMPSSLSESTEQPRWQDDPQAAAVMSAALQLAKTNEVTAIPLYAVSESPAPTIVDLSATLGIDFLMLGTSNRRFLTQLLKGDVAAEVARDLPENIQLVIYG